MKTLHSTVISAAAGIFLLAANPVNAQSIAETQLNDLLQDIETLSAEVLQLIVESDGGVLEESEIQMHLKRPNGFYWETLSPFPELVVTDGTTLWNFQPDLEQVVLEDWDSSQSELAAQLLSGKTENLSEEYSIAKLESSDISYSQFQLTPLAADSVYSEITINFSNSELESIHLANKNGQQTVWQFLVVERNSPLQDSLFSFEPPADVEIIDNSSGV